MRAIACLFALFCLAGPAAADPPAAAARYYAAGQYLAAAEIAEQHRSSDSLAFAARALMAACVATPNRDDLDALIVRAEAAARSALTRDPDSVDARLQLALTLGARGRRMSTTEAIRLGIAREGRRMIDEALVRAPNEPWAHALLGGWHLEVIRRGGRAGAVIYGARTATGIAEFERARALAPEDPTIALHYAVALIELDANRHQQRAGAILADIATMQPRDAFETLAQRQAARLEQALTEDGPAAANRLARRTFL